MITKKFTASDATFGGNTVNVCDLPEGIAFRLIPRDGLAAFPRTVQIDGKGGRELIDVVDSSWCLAAGATGIRINAAAMPLAAIWAALSTVNPVGFDKSNPPSELWTVQVATEECDLVAPAPQLPRVQTLWTVDAPPIAVDETHDVVSPLLDTSPWRQVLVSLFATADTARVTCAGFMDIEATPAISAALVIGAGGNQDSEIQLTSPNAAATQPKNKAALFTNEVTPGGASALVQLAPLWPYLYLWHNFFGTHNVRITVRGYR